MDFRKISHEVQNLKMISNCMFDVFLDSCEKEKLRNDVRDCLRELIDRYNDLYTIINDNDIF